MDNVEILNGLTTLPIPVERVVSGLVRDKDDFESILVLGLDENGKLLSRSSHSDIGEILAMMEQLKFNIFSGAYDDDQ